MFSSVEPCFQTNSLILLSVICLFFLVCKLCNIFNHGQLVAGESLNTSALFGLFEIAVPGSMDYGVKTLVRCK